MNNAELLAALQSGLGDKLKSHSESYGMLIAEVAREDFFETVKWLKEDTLQMNFLTDLCGMHYPDNKDRELGIVCHLHSLMSNTRLRLKSFFPMADPSFPSLTDLFSGANWMERETFDFYGIQFQGHPDLRRILNVDHMDYFPMRKEYALEDETRSDKSDKFFGR